MHYKVVHLLLGRKKAGLITGFSFLPVCTHLPFGGGGGGGRPILVVVVVVRRCGCYCTPRSIFTVVLSPYLEELGENNSWPASVSIDSGALTEPVMVVVLAVLLLLPPPAGAEAAPFYPKETGKKEMDRRGLLVREG